MYDVHAVHSGSHTWRDFVFHIATIAVGLLLALGLERLVEHLHHRSQLADARAGLRAELDANLKVVETNIAEATRITNELDNDLKILRAEPGSPGGQLEALKYEWNVRWPRDGAWQAFKQDGSLGLMPPDERQNYVYLYEAVDYEMRNLDAVAQQIDRAATLAEALRPPLKAADVDALRGATIEAKARVRYLLELLELARKAQIARSGAS